MNPPPPLAGAVLLCLPSVLVSRALRTCRASSTGLARACGLWLCSRRWSVGGEWLTIRVCV
eukprot:m.349460 g.349460  ORF g.349460 m.349460 type:complete len:61 (+) comp55883_c0_seq1:100-282(+)